MNYGMLWFDNDPKIKLSEKIRLASQDYEKKYGQVPNQCYVNPDTSIAEGTVGNAIKITATPTILLGHIWIGVNTAL